MGPFSDRLAALVSERRSQVCLGLDPDPQDLRPGPAPEAGGAAEKAADAVTAHCLELIEIAGPACVAIKPQVACFERLGAPGWRALTEVVRAGSDAGLLVIVDGKRGDVPVSAAVYADAMVGSTSTPWGEVEGLGADAFTVNPLPGGDSLDPFVAAAGEAGAGVFALVRTSNPGAQELQDSPPGGADCVPLYESLAGLVQERASKLMGPESGLSGMGAVIGATAPEHMARLRELMPDSIFLLPGVGAQGAEPGDIAAALAPGRPASTLVPVSRSIAGAPDPAEAAGDLRESLWSLGSAG